MATRASLEVEKASIPEGSIEPSWKSVSAGLGLSSEITLAMKGQYTKMFGPMYLGNGTTPHKVFAYDAKEYVDFMMTKMQLRMLELNTRITDLTAKLEEACLVQLVNAPPWGRSATNHKQQPIM